MPSPRAPRAERGTLPSPSPRGLLSANASRRETFLGFAGPTRRRSGSQWAVARARAGVAARQAHRAQQPQQQSTRTPCPLFDAVLLLVLLLLLLLARLQGMLEPLLC